MCTYVSDAEYTSSVCAAITDTNFLKKRLHGGDKQGQHVYAISWSHVYMRIVRRGHVYVI